MFEESGFGKRTNLLDGVKENYFLCPFKGNWKSFILVSAIFSVCAGDGIVI